MAKRGNIFYTDHQFTDAEVQEKFGFPAMLVLHSNSIIESISVYDENGNKSVFSGSGDLQKVLSNGNQSDKSIILKSTFGGADWSSTQTTSGVSFTKTVSGVLEKYISITPEIISFFRDNYNLVIDSESLTANRNITLPNASGILALKSDLDTKLDKPTDVGLNAIPKRGDGPSGARFESSMIFQYDGKIGVGTASNPTETLDVGGRIKSDGLVLNETSSAILPKEIKFKDGKFKGAKIDGIEKAFLMEGDSSGFDSLIDSLFYDNLAIMRPMIWNQTTYFTYNINGAGLYQAGQTAVPGIPYKIQYVSSAATIARIHGNSLGADFTRTFNIFRRFTIDTNISTQRVFIGYSDTWRQPGANPSNMAMSSLIYVVGICMESGNPNLLIVHNDNADAATIVDTGFVHSTNYIYELIVSHLSGESFIKIKLARINTQTGQKEWFEHNIMSNYMANTHYFAAWAVDSLNTATVKFSDYGGLRTERFPNINY